MDAVPGWHAFGPVWFAELGSPAPDAGLLV
jgi:hypothetical protein